MRSKITDPTYKPQFAGHETFPLRQLWLRKAYDAILERDANGATSRIFSDPESIVSFGVGKNMVSAIRHWALSCRIIQEDGGRYKPGTIGALLFGTQALDPYFENPASAWLIHWILAGEGNRATAWYFLFNHVPAHAFDKLRAQNSFRELLKKRPDVSVSEATLQRDLEVCLRSYVPKQSTKDIAEELAEPILAQLGLITATNGNYDFRIGPKPTLPDGIFLYSLTSFWNFYSPESSTISFDLIALERGSPGQVFKLDIDSVGERIVDIEHISGGIYAWSDTAGVRQVVRKKAVEPEYFIPSAYATKKHRRN